MLSSADVIKKHTTESKRKNQLQPDHLMNLTHLVGRWRDQSFYSNKLRSTKDFYSKLDEWINLYVETYISNLNSKGLKFAEDQAARDFVKHSF